MCKGWRSIFEKKRMIHLHHPQPKVTKWSLIFISSVTLPLLTVYPLSTLLKWARTAKNAVLWTIGGEGYLHATFAPLARHSDAVCAQIESRIKLLTHWALTTLSTHMWRRFCPVLAFPACKLLICHSAPAFYRKKTLNLVSQDCNCIVEHIICCLFQCNIL